MKSQPRIASAQAGHVVPRSRRPRLKNDSAEVRAAQTVETVSAAPATAATARPPWIFRGRDGAGRSSGGTAGA